MQRSETRFVRIEAFDKSAKKLREPGRGRVLNRAHEFQLAWGNSKQDSDIPGGFGLDQLAHEQGKYRVLEIRVTDWRLAVMILDDVSGAYWIHTWRKTGRRNPEDVRLSTARAEKLYTLMSKEREHGRE